MNQFLKVTNKSRLKDHFIIILNKFKYLYMINKNIFNEVTMKSLLISYPLFDLKLFPRDGFLDEKQHRFHKQQSKKLPQASILDGGKIC